MAQIIFVISKIRLYFNVNDNNIKKRTDTVDGWCNKFNDLYFEHALCHTLSRVTYYMVYDNIISLIQTIGCRSLLMLYICLFYNILHQWL